MNMKKARGTAVASIRNGMSIVLLSSILLALLQVEVLDLDKLLLYISVHHLYILQPSSRL